MPALPRAPGFAPSSRGWPGPGAWPTCCRVFGTELSLGHRRRPGGACVPGFRPRVNIPKKPESVCGRLCLAFLFASFSSLRTKPRLPTAGPGILEPFIQVGISTNWVFLSLLSDWARIEPKPNRFVPVRPVQAWHATASLPSPRAFNGSLSACLRWEASLSQLGQLGRPPPLCT